VTVSGKRVEAYTFVANPKHSQYAGDLGIERSAEIILDAQGVAGLNRDYLINTVRHLEGEGYADSGLHALLKRVEHLTGIIEAGGGI
jgi:cation transport protein ChaC